MVTDAIIGCIQIGLYSVAASSLICAWIMWESRYMGARLSSVRPSWRDDMEAIVSGKLRIDAFIERWSGKVPPKQTTAAPNWQTMNRDFFFGGTTVEDAISVCRDEDGDLLIESSKRPPDVTRIEGDCTAHIGCTNDECFWR